MKKKFKEQFHKYQQYKQPPLLLKLLNTTCGVRNAESGLGQAQKCGVVKPVNGISNPPVLIDIEMEGCKGVHWIKCGKDKSLRQNLDA